MDNGRCRMGQHHIAGKEQRGWGVERNTNRRVVRRLYNVGRTVEGTGIDKGGFQRKVVSKDNGDWTWVRGSGILPTYKRVKGEYSV